MFERMAITTAVVRTMQQDMIRCTDVRTKAK